MRVHTSCTCDCTYLLASMCVRFVVPRASYAGPYVHVCLGPPQVSVSAVHIKQGSVSRSQSQESLGEMCVNIRLPTRHGPPAS